MTGRYGIIAAVATACGGLLLFAASASVHERSASAHAPITTPVARETVLARVQAMNAVVHAQTRIESKLSTWADFHRAEGSHDVIGFIDPRMPVWVVAVAGTVAPPDARGEAYPSTVFVYSATSGEWVATFANPNGGGWPAYFDQLVDLAR